MAVHSGLAMASRYTCHERQDGWLRCEGIGMEGALLQYQQTKKQR